MKSIFKWLRVGFFKAKNLNILCSMDSNTNSKQLLKSLKFSLECT